jgi:hypothetical protein
MQEGAQRRCVKSYLDSLATALYVKADDLLKDSPHLAPWRPAVGIASGLTDAELVTLAMMQAILGFTSEAKWLGHALAHLRHLCPHLPEKPGYNKRHSRLDHRDLEQRPHRTGDPALTDYLRSLTLESII